MIKVIAFLLLKLHIHIYVCDIDFRRNEDFTTPVRKRKQSQSETPSGKRSRRHWHYTTRGCVCPVLETLVDQLLRNFLSILCQTDCSTKKPLKWKNQVTSYMFNPVSAEIILLLHRDEEDSVFSNVDETSVSQRKFQIPRLVKIVFFIDLGDFWFISSLGSRHCSLYRTICWLKAWCRAVVFSLGSRFEAV